MKRAAADPQPLQAPLRTRVAPLRLKVGQKGPLRENFHGLQWCARRSAIVRRGRANSGRVPQKLCSFEIGGGIDVQKWVDAGVFEIHPADGCAGDKCLHFAPAAVAQKALQCRQQLQRPERAGGVGATGAARAGQGGALPRHRRLQGGDQVDRYKGGIAGEAGQPAAVAVVLPQPVHGGENARQRAAEVRQAVGHGQQRVVAVAGRVAVDTQQQARYLRRGAVDDVFQQRFVAQAHKGLVATAHAAAAAAGQQDAGGGGRGGACGFHHGLQAPAAGSISEK